jgi:uronate dehydrogenase
VRRILVTGAAGRIGSQLCPRLVRPGRVLRLLDLAPIAPAPGIEPVVADLTDPAAMAAACAGVDAVVHLGAIPTEAPWADLLRVNIDGTRVVLEAAQGAGVARVVLASTMHAAGFWPRACAPAGLHGAPQSGPDGLPAAIPARPDTYYGVSKAAVEALGSLYADRFGMAVFALRLGACFPEPLDESLLDCWLSPQDCARLVEACLSTAAGGFRVLWGVSRNSSRWWSLAEGNEIGYAPEEDSHRYGDLLPANPEGDAPDRLGRHFCTLPLGEWSHGGPPRQP